MEQSWWVYGSIALGCALLFLLAKVIESKFMKEDEGLALFQLIIALIGLIATYKAAMILSFFS